MSSSLSNKRIANLEELHIGESRVMQNARKATIIRFKNECDMDVLFDNGHVLEHVSYYDFLNRALGQADIINFTAWRETRGR